MPKIKTKTPKANAKKRIPAKSKDKNAASDNNHNSKYNFLRQVFEFTNEPLWFRLVITLMMMLFVLAAILLLKTYVLPVSLFGWIFKTVRSP